MMNSYGLQQAGAGTDPRTVPQQPPMSQISSINEDILRNQQQTLLALEDLRGKFVGHRPVDKAEGLEPSRSLMRDAECIRGQSESILKMIAELHEYVGGDLRPR
jgi:hypothetical protein